MKTGTPIEFKAVFESIGTEWKPHHLHLEWINITNDFMKDKVNVTLFKGISFDIEGHMELKNAIEHTLNTPEEKIENINLLLSLLNKLFDTELDIDPKKIVIEKDKESAKILLELLLDVTTTLLNSGAEFEEEEDEFEERKMNISDPGMKYNEESVESLRLGKDKKKEKKTKKEDNMNIKGLDKEKSQSGENLIYDKDDKDNNDLENDIDIDNINDNEEKKK